MFSDFNNTTNSTNPNYLYHRDLNYVDILIIIGFGAFMFCFCTSIHYSRRHTKYTTVTVVKPKINI